MCVRFLCIFILSIFYKSPRAGSILHIIKRWDQSHHVKKIQFYFLYVIYPYLWGVKESNKIRIRCNLKGYPAS